nr:hypothetical protein [Burkholderia sp. MS455]
MVSLEDGGTNDDANMQIAYSHHHFHHLLERRCGLLLQCVQLYRILDSDKCTYL